MFTMEIDLQKAKMKQLFYVSNWQTLVVQKRYCLPGIISPEISYTARAPTSFRLGTSVHRGSKISLFLILNYE